MGGGDPVDTYQEASQLLREGSWVLSWIRFPRTTKQGTLQCVQARRLPHRPEGRYYR